MADYCKLTDNTLLEIEIDRDPISPRTEIYENLGTMYGFNKFYPAPDGKTTDIEEAVNELVREVAIREHLVSSNQVDNTADKLIAWRIPKYLRGYDEEKTIENTVDFLREHGYAVAAKQCQYTTVAEETTLLNYASPETIKKVYGNYGIKEMQLALKELKGENDAYGQYLTGNVYSITQYKINGSVINGTDGYFADSVKDAAARYIEDAYSGNVEIEKFIGYFNSIDDCIERHGIKVVEPPEASVSENDAEDLLSKYSDAELQAIKKLLSKKSLNEVKKSIEEKKEGQTDHKNASSQNGRQ